MASLPQQPQQPPRSRRSSSSQSEEPNDVSHSTATLDSQTVLVNEPTSPIASSPHPEKQAQAEEEPRKCWICFSDETEDTPETSMWKSPCPCALVAHEACLLDWIADMESPQNRSRQRKKIQCPQCKTEIQISRPKSLLVSSVAAVDRIAGRLTIPALVGSLGASILSGLWFHGMTSVYIIFGRADFKRLTAVTNGERLGPKWLLGAPMIPMALIASRTRLADGVLPILPVLFFATHVPSTPYRPDTLWPPSAAMTFASLPYIRAIYNQAYRYMFAEKERQWMRALQPRMTEDSGQDQAEEGVVRPAQAPDHDHDHDHNDNDNEEGIGGIQLDLEIIHEEVDIGDQPERQAQEHADEVHRIWDEAIVQADAAANPQPEAPGAHRGQGAAGNNGNHDGFNMLINAGRAADAVMGALCFPVVAAVAGEVLEKVLPAAMTVSNGLRRPGLLQTRWGRSVVGGCLFVAVKDTLLLYSRYKLAKGQRERKIVNWSQRQDRGERAPSSQ
jgi:hypothetical protein